MNSEFVAEKNMQLIWNILEENYKEKMSSLNFKQDFQMLKRRIGSAQSEFKNLIEMNKLFLMECSKLLEVKPTKISIFNTNLKKKEDEFKKMLDKDVPPSIDFKTEPKGDFDGNIGDLYSKQMQERKFDIANIAKGYNMQNAQEWIKSEDKPPPLSIDHNTVKNITSEHLDISNKLVPIRHAASHPPPQPPPKHVTFQTPLENHNFLTKLKKKTVDNFKTQNLCVRADEISNNKIFFSKTMGYVKEFTFKKIILPNIQKKIINVLKQKTIKKLSDHFFINYIIRINGHIERSDLLMIKKNYDDKMILFDMDENISVNEEVKRMEISIYNSQNDPIIIPSFLELQYFIRGSQLTVNRELHPQFCNDIYSFLIFNDDMFYVGETFLVKDELVTIMGTCRVDVKDGRYSLIDVDHKNNKNHNCCIIKWSGDNINVIQSASRVPVLHFSMIS